MTSFLHLTDPHIGTPEDEAARGANAPSARLDAVLAGAAGLEPQPAFAVITGDLADHGAPEAYRFLAGILEKTDLPVFLTLGNHDDGNAFGAVFGGSEGPPCRDAAIGGLHLILLDTGVPGRTGGTLSGAALAALDGALARHANLPKLLALHHPPRAANGPENGWHALTGAASDALAVRLAGHRLAGVLSGHVHFDSVRIWQGAPLITNTGLATAIDPGDKVLLHQTEGAGYGLCHWDGDALSVSFAPIAPARRLLRKVPTAQLSGGT